MSFEIIAGFRPVNLGNLQSPCQSSVDAIEAALLDIGLNRKELVIYKTLLALGPRPASVLAKQVQINRSRTYDHLAALKGRGLVETFHRNGVLRFSAVSPETVISILKSRRERFERIIAACEVALLTFSTRTNADNGSGIPVDYSDF